MKRSKNKEKETGIAILFVSILCFSILFSHGDMNLFSMIGSSFILGVIAGYFFYRHVNVDWWVNENDKKIKELKLKNEEEKTHH